MMRFPTASMELRQENKRRRALQIYKSATILQWKHPCDNWSTPDAVSTSRIGDEQ